MNFLDHISKSEVNAPKHSFRDSFVERQGDCQSRHTNPIRQQRSKHQIITHGEGCFDKFKRKMGHHEQLSTRLWALLKSDENQTCVDCLSSLPTWAALVTIPPGCNKSGTRIGALCCFECSKAHRVLGTKVSLVRDVDEDNCKFNRAIQPKLAVIGYCNTNKCSQ